MTYELPTVTPYPQREVSTSVYKNRKGREMFVLKIEAGLAEQIFANRDELALDRLMETLRERNA